ncbi:MAG: hypothetical protein E6Q97_07835 [Desulfurellales bacterium]|nr:MAG: hypothetical protein E6Q97_07835 [Desulfurellales bacterium]
MRIVIDQETGAVCLQDGPSDDSMHRAILERAVWYVCAMALREDRPNPPAVRTTLAAIRDRALADLDRLRAAFADAALDAPDEVIKVDPLETEHETTEEWRALPEIHANRRTYVMTTGDASVMVSWDSRGGGTQWRLAYGGDVTWVRGPVICVERELEDRMRLHAKRMGLRKHDKGTI